MERLDT